MSNITITCKCVAVIPSDNIRYYNRNNEEGEDCFEVDAECNKCHHLYEANSWGECNSLDEACEFLNDYIKTNYGNK